MGHCKHGRMRNGLVVQGTPGRAGGDVPLAVQVPNCQVERFHFAIIDTSDRWHQAVWKVAMTTPRGLATGASGTDRQCGSFVGHSPHGRMRNGLVVRRHTKR